MKQNITLINKTKLTDKTLIYKFKKKYYMFLNKKNNTTIKKAHTDKIVNE